MKKTEDGEESREDNLFRIPVTQRQQRMGNGHIREEWERVCGNISWWLSDDPHHVDYRPTLFMTGTASREKSNSHMTRRNER
jgi:hypothetical protein